MNSKLFFVIGLITVSAVFGADSDYNFKNDLDRCVDTSDSLCDGASENAGNCELYQGLVNISTKVQVNLTVTQRTTFTTFIEKCKTEIFAVSTFTNEEKFIEFSAYLEEFSLANQDIYGIIIYQNISKWSSIHTVEKVTTIKQQKLIQKSLTWESSTGSCPICDGLKEAAQETGDASCVTDVENVIETKIKVIMKDSSISFEEKTIKIQTEIEKIYVSHASFESKLKFKKIKGFGRFNQFFKCVKTYKQVQEAPALCTGTFPNIPIIAFLQTQLNIYKKTDIKVALQFNQFIQRVNQSFTEITSVEERHVWFANYVQQWSVLNYNFCMKYIITTEFGEFGNCYDFCYCEGFEGPVIVAVPTELPEEPVTTPVAPTTEEEDEEFTDEYSSSTSFFTELPSSSSSCGCVCE